MNLIDNNTTGPDNRGSDSLVGTHSAVTDECGQAVVPLTVSMQPGDDGDPCTNDVCQGGDCEHPPINDGAICAESGGPCAEYICSDGIMDPGARRSEKAGVMHGDRRRIRLPRVGCSPSMTF